TLYGTGELLKVGRFSACGMGGFGTATACTLTWARFSRGYFGFGLSFQSSFENHHLNLLALLGSLFGSHLLGGFEDLVYVADFEHFSELANGLVLVNKWTTSD